MASPGVGSRRAAPLSPIRVQEKDQVEYIIRQLNFHYSLGIRQSDYVLKTKSPQEQQKPQRDLLVRRKLLLHYKIRDADTNVQEVLDQFHRDACRAASRWVDKKFADPDLLPTASTCPKATTPRERDEFLSVFMWVLEAFAPGQGSEVSSKNLITDDEAHDLKSSSMIRSPVDSMTRLKRQSDERADGSSTKRVKDALTAQIDDLPTIPKYPGGSTTMTTTRPAAAISPAVHQGDIFASFFNESRTTLVSNTFSGAGSQRSALSSQTTVEAPCQEKRGTQSQDCFPPSTRDLIALNESFSPFEDTGDPDASRLRRIVEIRQKTPIPSTVYSSVPLINDLPVLAVNLKDRLDIVWPVFPIWLRSAPLSIAWEATRIANFCSVSLQQITLQPRADWSQDELRATLRRCPEFHNKDFPGRCADEAWSAAATNFTHNGRVVLLSISIDFNTNSSGPLFSVRLEPLKLDQPCRLTRRFGPDRFMEVLFPSPTSFNAPEVMKGDGGVEEVNKWLTRELHDIVGRRWAAFWTKDAGYKQPAKEVLLGPGPKPVFKDRVYLFAEDGYGFGSPRSPNGILSRAEDDSPRRRTSMKVSVMLDWLLQLSKNEDQPLLKLFARIQLGLSKTFPTVVFEPHQIREIEVDLISPAGKVMNDGIGRMSRSVARKVMDVLGLISIPCAIQGRIGSAKGMWIIDVLDDEDEDWIETYPSQRKWVCDLADPDQRTLEVRGHASELKPARLNLQFLPVLEDRAIDKHLMRHTIADLLTSNLRKDLHGQRTAMKHPVQFRQWVSENTSSRQDRVLHNRVDFLAGLPTKPEEAMTMFLDSGFDPKAQKYIQEIAYTLQRKKCDLLKKKLSIQVGRSATVYMVVDFWGFLEEDEVHMCFSTRFQDEDFSETLLHNMDVLVARSPAHFISDVQRIKAVFKPELHFLKDVIVFSSKGNVALAEKLSGGDYDGDLAWVCWDPNIVNNFTNAAVPPNPDLFSLQYLRKQDKLFKDVVQASGSHEEAVGKMIEQGCFFNTKKNLLGICTNYKEKLCYQRRNVHDNMAVILSTLLSNLVDQSKQGIDFTIQDWNRLKKELLDGQHDLPDPGYKLDNWSGKNDHIIDFLKFSVAKPAIDAELRNFHLAMDKDKSHDVTSSGANHFDLDLVAPCKAYEGIAEHSEPLKHILDSLKADILQVRDEWDRLIGRSNKRLGEDLYYTSAVLQVFQKWRAIQPDRSSHSGVDNSQMVEMLLQPWLPDADATSSWSLLRASTAFKLLYPKKPSFVFQMAGAQLAIIKAMMRRPDGGAPVLVVPGMYAALRPDTKFIKQVIARMEGEGSEYSMWDDHDDDDDDDDRDVEEE